MSVLMIILGVLLTICGISCTFTPLATFMETGYFILILVLVYGIAGIVRAVMTKEYGVEFLFSILTVIFGLIVAFVPGLKLLTDGVLIYFVAAWFVIQGLVSIFTALRAKSFGLKSWVWGLIIGIIGVLLGIYSFIHPALLAMSIGILIGVYFMVTGINMIIIALEIKTE